MSVPKDEIKPQSRDDAEVMLCPECMTANDPLADFCRQCGRPLSSLATMDPMKQIYAQGWIYRKAISGRTSPIVFWGMWLIFGPLVLLPVLSLLFLMCNRRSVVSLDVSVPGFVLSTGLLALYAAILYRVTKSYLRYRQQKPGYCEECGYNLFGLTEPRCPECGTPFDPEDLSEDTRDDTTKQGPKRLVNGVDIGYATAVGCWYVLALAAGWAENARGFARVRGEDVCLALASAAIALNLALWIVTLKLIVGSSQDRRSWLFWVACLANVVLTLSVILSEL